ncbi:hypothetical protein SO802_031894 [Lithocarpus litseifolius]|uniref:Major facilitator superfamily (MFS) profile domain-containing protein n=1 Tax=Lithocarpus litseifolius TaxID=425828 RepID=A0AAW2BNJ8_9ROSI
MELWRVFKDAIAGMANGGGIFGGVLGLIISEWQGRRKGIFFADSLFLTGYAVMAIPHLLAIFVARFIVGTALGVAAVVCPLYIYDFVPSSTRGRFMSVMGVCMTLGQTFAYLVTQGLFKAPGWRWMLMVASIPAAVQALFMWRLRETPRWLLLTGKHHEALESMLLYYPESRALQDFEEMQSLIGQAVSSFPHNTTIRILTNLYRPFTNLAFKKSLLSSILINCTHIVGVGTAAYSGKVDRGSMDSPLVGSFLNVLASFATMFSVDYLSRKKVLNVSLILVSVIFLSLSLVSFNAISPAAVRDNLVFSNQTCNIPEDKWNCVTCLKADCAFCASLDLMKPGNCLKYENASGLLCLQQGRKLMFKTCPTTWSKLTSVLIEVYGIVHSLGLSSIPVIMSLELFATQDMNLGSGIGSTAGWFVSLIGSLVFQPLTENLGGLYLANALCSSIVLAAVWYVVPETN